MIPKSTPMLCALVLALAAASCLSATAQLTTIEYKQADGAVGYFAVDPKLSGRRPGVIIISETGALDTFARGLVTAWAGQGYAAFALDAYDGSSLTTSSLLISSNTTLTLFNIRIAAAITLLRNKHAPSDIALLGYGVGGVGVLNAVVKGLPGFPAAVAIYPELATTISFLTRGSVNTTAYTLVVADRIKNQQYIGQLELQLSAVNSSWETVRLSKVDAGFANKALPTYNAYADARSTQLALSFISSSFSENWLTTSRPANLSAPGIVSMVTNYTATNNTVEGLLVYNTSLVRSPTTKLPAYLVIPDNNGYDDYEIRRQHLLAAEGYVTFSVNMYGWAINETRTNATERAAVQGSYSNNPTLFVERIQGALDKLKSYPFVDTEAITVIGYCFGGTGVHNFWKAGKDAMVAVAYHGGLAPPMPAVNASTVVKPFVLVQSGGSDESQLQIDLLVSNLTVTNADWELTRYSNVFHAFTVWGGARFHPRADGRSWKAQTDIVALKLAALGKAGSK